MIRGDIGNEIPRRILVTHRSISTKREEKRKFLFFLSPETIHTYDRPSLLVLWKFAERTGVSFELVVFEDDGLSTDDAMELLDDYPTSPIRSATYYSDTEELISDLVYRPEVLGVLDDPKYRARYGGYAVPPDYFDRII